MFTAFNATTGLDLPAIKQRFKSCRQCRVRKQKCDRSYPSCKQCLARGERDCDWSNAQPSQHKIDEAEELAGKLDRLEEIVRKRIKLDRALVKHDRKPSIASVTTVNHSRPASPALTAGDRSGSEYSPTPVSPPKKPEPATNGDDNSEVDCRTTNWAGAFESMVLRPHASLSLARSEPLVLEAVNILKTLPSVAMDSGYTFSESFSSYTFEDLLAILPPFSQCDAMVELWYHSPDYMFHPFHIPQLRSRYQELKNFVYEYKNSPTTPDLSVNKPDYHWWASFFAGCAAAIFYLNSRPTLPESFANLDPKSYTRNLIKGALIALRLGETPYTFEAARCRFILARFFLNLSYFELASDNIHEAARIACNIDLHQDPVVLGYPKHSVEAEERRRLIWDIVSLDWKMCSIYMKTASPLDESFFQVDLPLQISDQELDNITITGSMPNFSLPIENNPERISAVGRHHDYLLLRSLRRTILSLYTSPYPTKSKLLEMDRTLLKLESEIPSILRIEFDGRELKSLPSGNPRLDFAKIRLYILLTQAQLKLHSPFLKDGILGYVHRDRCLWYGALLLSIQKTSVIPASCALVQYTYLKAAMILVVELLLRPQIHEAERIKNMAIEAMKLVDCPNSDLIRRCLAVLAILLNKVGVDMRWFSFTPPNPHSSEFPRRQPSNGQIPPPPAPPPKQPPPNSSGNHYSVPTTQYPPSPPVSGSAPLSNASYLQNHRHSFHVPPAHSTPLMNTSNLPSTGDFGGNYGPSSYEMAYNSDTRPASSSSISSHSPMFSSSNPNPAPPEFRPRQFSQPQLHRHHDYPFSPQRDVAPLIPQGRPMSATSNALDQPVQYTSIYATYPQTGVSHYSQPSRSNYPSSYSNHTSYNPSSSYPQQTRQ